MPSTKGKKPDQEGEDPKSLEYDLEEKPSSKEIQYSLKYDLEVKQSPRDYLWASIISFPCNPIFSIIAIIMSVKSRKANKEGRMKRADHFGRSAIMFALFGFMLSLFIAVLVFDLKFQTWFPDLYAKIYDPDYWTKKSNDTLVNATLVSHE